jgi:trk system potassium uptake protein TrkH
MATARDGGGALGALPYLGYMIFTTSTSILASGLYGAYRIIAWGAGGEQWAAEVYLAFGLAYLLAGYALTRQPRATLTHATAVTLTVVSWITIPVLAAVPFMVAARIPFIDALFESVSGWTTTGLTILTGEPSSWRHVYVPRVEELPRTLQVWRTLMQWEGGLGIVVFTIGVLAAPGISAAALYLAEGRVEKIEASVAATAWKMFIIYSTLTGVSAALFFAAGMPLYDAISHAMTGVATAGFSTHSESIGYYISNRAVMAVAMVAILSGAINFRDHYNILTFRLRELARSVELKAQAVILSLAVLASLYVWARSPSFHESFTPLQVVFHVVSSSSTAGFQAGDLGSTPDAYKAILAFLALLGGSAFSTAGGIKVLRLVVLARLATIEAALPMRPYGYKPSMRLGGRRLTEQYIRSVAVTAAAMVLTHFTLTIALAAAYPLRYTLADAAFEVASAMGNVGLSVGISAASAPVGAKLDLIAAMLLGRLEVMAYLVALYYAAQRLSASGRRPR